MKASVDATGGDSSRSDFFLGRIEGQGSELANQTNNREGPFNTGSGGPDLIVGDGKAASEGGANSDTLRGADTGDDVIFGDNWMSVASAIDSNGGRADTINGGNGNDVIFGQGGDDTLNGDGGNDQIFGGGGNDFVAGGHGNDLMAGGAGNDTLSAAGTNNGSDTMEGGDGADTFLFDGGALMASNRAHVITDFEDGIDTIVIDDNRINNFGQVEIAQDGLDTVLTFNASARDGSITLENFLASDIDAGDFLFA